MILIKFQQWESGKSDESESGYVERDRNAHYSGLQSKCDVGELEVPGPVPVADHTLSHAHAQLTITQWAIVHGAGRRCHLDKHIGGISITSRRYSVYDTCSRCTSPIELRVDVPVCWWIYLIYGNNIENPYKFYIYLKLYVKVNTINTNRRFHQLWQPKKYNFKVNNVKYAFPGLTQLIQYLAKITTLDGKSFY